MRLRLAVRDALARLLLDAFHDAGARRCLERLVTAGRGGAPIERSELPAALGSALFDQASQPSDASPSPASSVVDRAERAWRVLDRRPLDEPDVPLRTALEQAAALFDARLYFEVHELLEPHWMRAEGGARAGLQALIQITVGLEHLANANVAGARSLVRAGIAKLSGGGGKALQMDVRAFTGDLRRCLADLDSGAAPGFEWSRVPGFPAPSASPATLPGDTRARHGRREIR